MLILFICMLLTTCLIYGQGDCPASAQDVEVKAGREYKYYIHPWNICFSEKAIFISFDKELIEVEAIFVDENGLYFKFPSGKYP